MKSKRDTRSGHDALLSGTRLLQRVRSEHPTAGMWEAADLSWWWRQERASDQVEQVLWSDDDGPVAAVWLTAWKRSWQVDVIMLPSLRERLLVQVVDVALDRAHDVPGGSVEMLVPEEESDLTTRLKEAGWYSSGERGAALWMDVHDHVRVAPAPDGYQGADRVHEADLPHHMAPRAGEGVEQRLLSTPLYRLDLDLVARTTTGAMAGDAIFWFDRTTRTGFVEPMGTQEGHRRKGLARHLLTNGLDRLAALGARRVRVNVALDNDPAIRLYTSAGFEITSMHTAWTA